MASQKRGGAHHHYGDRSHHSKRSRPNQPTYNTTTTTYHAQPELSAADMHSGLVALLDRFVAAETTPEADKDILLHATELRRLLCCRRPHAASAAAKHELDQKRPDKALKLAVPSYVYRKVLDAKGLPPLPPITEPHLHEAVFTHQSVHVTNLSVHQGIDLGLDYERLELLGDAYIELMASRALYNRFPHVDIPQLSSWRERLVENLALGKFSEAYGFPDRLKAKVTWDKESKAWKKVVADLFEAYVAGVVLSDPDHGFETAEKWLDELWAPQLLTFKERVVENPRARDDLQKLVFVNHIKLDYREERPMTYINGAQRFYLGVYLTGWGYNNEWLGSGDGQNKAQAAISAATDAIKRNNNALQDASRQKAELMQVRAKQREDEARVEGQPQAQGEDASIVVNDALRPPAENAEDTTEKRKFDGEATSSVKKSKKHNRDAKERKEKKRNTSSEGGCS